MGEWDRKIKILVAESPQDFVSWLIKEAQFECILAPRFPSREVESDVLLQINVDGKTYILHIEFQKRSDPTMGRRMWEYNALASLKYGHPVFSVVIYLTKDGPVAEAPYCINWHDGQEIHRFRFEVIKLWEIRAEELLQSGPSGLLPLLSLTQGGKQRDMIEQVIKKLSPEDELPHKELLSLTYGFAALVFKDDDDIRWLKWRFSLLKDILYNTWAYQELIQEGREEGLKEGREEGLKEGREEGLKEGLKEAVLVRFSALAQLAEKKCALLNSYEEIKALFDAIICAQSEAEARQHLQNVVKRETDKTL